MFLSLGIPIAYATSFAVMHLDFIDSNIGEGSTITFSGQLTSLNGSSISHRTIFIEDDTNYYIRPDIIIAITTTDSDGHFSVSWKAIPKDNRNSFHFYALFLGGTSFGYTRSETYESVVKRITPDSTAVIPSKTFPIWFKNASKMWHDGQIRDMDYSWSIKNLVEHGIITSNTVNIESKLPAWLKNNANWFADGVISEEEYVNNLQYLLDNHLI
jgi:hypothetical protein